MREPAPSDARSCRADYFRGVLHLRRFGADEGLRARENDAKQQSAEDARVRKAS